MVDGSRNIVLGDVIPSEDVADLGEFANHLLEPELEGLVDDDEVHLVGVYPAVLPLQFQQFVQP